MRNQDRSAWLFDQPQGLIQAMIHQIEKVIVGKREIIEKTVLALLSGGHVLLEDVPGIGKTMLVKALAGSLGLDVGRIQFTPDLLPSDVTGNSIYSRKKEDFEFRPGPIFHHLVIADELNRASARTQSALLEAMEERQITIDGQTRALPTPFMLLATQNPLDSAGTYVLPEAQLDRFLMKLSLGYPEYKQEIDMLTRQQDMTPLHQVKAVLCGEELLELQKEVRSIFVDPTLKEYIVSLNQATRKHRHVAVGASPRSSLMMMRAAQAAAFMQGRTYVVPDDIKMLAVDVLSHRLLLKDEAKWDGLQSARIVEELIETTPTPGLKFAAGGLS